MSFPKLWFRNKLTAVEPKATAAVLDGGVAVAAYGTKSIAWSSLSKILLSWIVSPGVAGCAGAILYLITKYGVLKSTNSFNRGLIAVPIYFMLALGISFFYVLLKAPKGIDISKPANSKKIGLALGLTFGWVGLVGLFTFFFLVPWFRRLLQNEEDMKFYHIFMPWVGEQPKNPNIYERVALHAQGDRVWL